MRQKSRRSFAKPKKTVGNNGARTSPLQGTIVKPEQVPSMKPFGLNIKVLLSTEAHRIDALMTGMGVIAT
jgi:hypothetical protein